MISGGSRNRCFARATSLRVASSEWFRRWPTWSKEGFSNSRRTTAAWSSSDGSGNQQTETDALGHTTTTLYDPLYQATTMISAMGGVTTIT